MVEILKCLILQLTEATIISLKGFFKSKSTWLLKKCCLLNPLQYQVGMLACLHDAGSNSVAFLFLIWLLTLALWPSYRECQSEWFFLSHPRVEKANNCQGVHFRDQSMPHGTVTTN